MRREYPEAPIAGVGAVVIDRGKVLLVRRGQEPMKGEWSLPGGALELGETLAEGVVREVWEETGLRVAPAGIIEVFDRITRDDAGGRVRYHYVLVDFLCSPIDGNLRCSSDAADARWAAREELVSRSCPEGTLHAHPGLHPDVYLLSPFTMRVIDKGFAMAAGAGAPASLNGP